MAKVQGPMAATLMPIKKQIKIQTLISKKLIREAATRKAKKSMFDGIDLRYFDAAKNDPFSQFDRKKQKILINPGVPYVSTSQPDVFELRGSNTLQGTNKFVKHAEENDAQADRLATEGSEKVFKSPFRPH